jgi:hypothetical protein
MIARGLIRIVLLMGALVLINRPVIAVDVDFARDIQPIFAKRCFACHGPAKRESGIAFHVRALAVGKSESGERAIVPGNPAASELLNRVTADDETQRMPPDGQPLSPREVGLLREWIRQGAAYAKHWAFVKPARPAIPKVKRSGWVRNEIDRFILARMEREGLSPSPLVDRAKLIRRLSIDLLGLLPRAADAEAFAKDTSEQAYEKVIDRLLASDHFGERWGRHWLDLARYADTFGYERDDVRPNAWRYRDWVINSLNRNQPFDRFVIEQLAGDLLDQPSLQQRIATGLHRMNIKNNESGINREDYRNRETVDRVNTTGTAFLGLTIGCGQCHSHKYDPISQKEYYQFYAFFNNVEEKDVDIPGTPADRARYEQALAAYNSNKKRLESQKILLDELRKHTSPERWRDSLANRNREWAIRSKRVETAAGKNLDRWTVGLTQADAVAFGFAKKVAAAISIPEDKRTDEQVRLLREFHPSLKEKAREISARIQSPAQHLKVLDLDESLKSALAAAGPDTKEQQAAAGLFWSALVSQLDDARKAIRQLSVQKRHLPKPYIMTLAEATKNRRRTHFLVRGDFKQKGEEVVSVTPAVFNPLSVRGEVPDRLDLARWIVGRDNPLTARVAVNHIWSHLFGAGIVASTDDFGTQGESPSHPRLLDWLAVEFVESGWDRKRLIKTIVLSATYRQTARGRSELQAIDPENRLLARQSRFRVEAEIVRDLFLDAGDLLHRRLGGPTIHPAVPSAVSDIGYKYKTRWILSSKPERYRRGLYIYFKRTNPYPSLTIFDSPESNLCLAKRNRSNTPLQALTTLNDPVFVECAQALGQILARQRAGSESRVQFAAWKCLTRSLKSAEVRTLLNLFEAEKNWYGRHADEAAKLIGDYGDKNVPNSEAAAWVAVARAMLNLDEFVTRE